MSNAVDVIKVGVTVIVVLLVASLGMISFIPMGCTIVLNLIVPIILYAVSMFQEIQNIKD